MTTLLLEILIGILLILAVRFLFGHRLGPRLCRVLWLLVVIRALTPMTVPLPYHPRGLLLSSDEAAAPFDAVISTDEEMIPIHRIAETETVSTPVVFETEITEEPISTNRTSNFFLPGIWLIGFATILVTALVRNRRIIVRATRQPTPVPDWVQEIFLEIRETLRIGTWPVLIVTPHVPTPCLVGAVRPRILIPESLVEDDADRNALRHMILHEMVHLKYGDLWFSWLWTLTVAVHWFNPLFWLIGRFVKLDCEAACDDRVLEMLENREQKDYGLSLLHIMQTLNPAPAAYAPGSCAVIENSSNLERRLKMMTLHRKPSVRRTLAGTLVLLLLAGFTLTGYAEQKPISSEKAKMIGYVEDFFMNNYRDVSMRKSLEWGDVKTEKNGNSSIRYKYDALIWDKDRISENKIWTFTKDGEFVSVENVEGFPKKLSAGKPASSPAVDLAFQFLSHLREKEFDKAYRLGSKEFQNGVSIEGLKTIWDSISTGHGKFTGSSSASSTGSLDSVVIEFRDKYEKNLVLYRIAAKDGVIVDFHYIDSFLVLPSLEIETVKSSETMADPKEITATQFIMQLAGGEFAKAHASGNEAFKKKITSGDLEKLWKTLSLNYGKFAGMLSINTSSVEILEIYDIKCKFENVTTVFRVTVDQDSNVAGFFVISALPNDFKGSDTIPENDAKPVTPDPKASKLAAAGGWRLFMQGKPDEAEPKFQEAVRLDPKNANAYQGLSWAQTNLGLVEEAKKTFEKCLELDPKNAAALNGLGVIARNEGDEKTMLDVWKRAVDADKKATGPIAGLAGHYEKQGDKENAAKYYKMWVDADPNDAGAKEGLKRVGE